MASTALLHRCRLRQHWTQHTTRSSRLQVSLRGVMARLLTKWPARLCRKCRARTRGGRLFTTVLRRSGRHQRLCTRATARTLKPWSCLLPATHTPPPHPALLPLSLSPCPPLLTMPVSCAPFTVATVTVAATVSLALPSQAAPCLLLRQATGRGCSS